jgi:hypothetical protein
MHRLSYLNLNSEYPCMEITCCYCRAHCTDASEHCTVSVWPSGVPAAETDLRSCLINLVTTLTRNPPDTHSRNHTGLRLCCVLSNSLQCGAPCDVSTVQAVYKLRTSYGTRRFSVTVRMLTGGRHRNLFNIMTLGLELHLYLSYIHTLFFDTTL